MDPFYVGLVVFATTYYLADAKTALIVAGVHYVANQY
jgi:hypothetical protein